MDKIIGMGNALVDVLVTLQGDALLDEMNLPKGSMQLIDEAKFLKIRNKFADGIVNFRLCCSLCFW